ncbi:hypothetical protein V5735_17665 (plasmid) [Haladaptatus sp. SPP-AMP-3]|uniref:hypothetical protein n=1 Tax=Haladaptatus sp. SPP-AMP-3 TaxID=3121295 RepID=UPI003C2ECDCB
MTVVASLFAVGFVGNAAAFADDNQAQYSEQHAWSGVSQDQYVAQGNANSQDTNVAASAALGWDDEAESGDAYAAQYNEQENENAQAAWSSAENYNWQNQDD